jgi:hypothetical protein
MRIVALALLLGGCAGAGEGIAARDADALAATLAGRTPAPAVDCIDARAALHVEARTLIATDGSRLWRNEAAGCIGLDSDVVVIVEPSGSQLCRGDRFRTLPRGGSIPSPYCRIERFVPYVQAP